MRLRLLFLAMKSRGRVGHPPKQTHGPSTPDPVSQKKKDPFARDDIF
jgi:hypothetical protein